MYVPGTKRGRVEDVGAQYLAVRRDDEGVYLARFDLDAIRAYRERETWGNAFRRPDRYGPLTATDVEEPFVRVDAQGERYDRVRR